MKKYQVYHDRNVEWTNVAEFDTLEEAKDYCDKGTQGFNRVSDKDNDFEGRGNNFCYKVYEGEPVVLDDAGDVMLLNNSVYETQWYYL